MTEPDIRVRNGGGRRGVAIIALLAVSAWPSVLRAQESGVGEDVEALVRAGEVETLHERFHGGRTPEEMRLLAFAQTNRAGLAAAEEACQEAYKDAEARFLAWIAVAENDPDSDRIQRKVNAGQARLAYAEMILSKWAAKDLDDFEISGGKRCRTDRLVDLLLTARDVLDQAAQTVQPMVVELLDAARKRDEEVEERYLAAGIFNAAPRLLLDVQYNRAWANLYISMTDSDNAARRSEALRAAERDFGVLVEADQIGETAARCELGLAMTFREQARHEEARRHFERVINADVSFFTIAQARYEAARNELKYGRFDEARALLGPLTRLDLRRLSPEEAAARFYLNLAALWEANSRLVEADYLERAAGESAVGAAMRAKARNARENGLLNMNDLAERGGSWTPLVQLYVEEAIDLDEAVDRLSAPALLFSARRLIERKEYAPALERLEIAARRDGLDKNLEATLLFEQGACRYRQDEQREAAALFARVACEHSGSPKAARAVTFAFGLWSRLAEESRRSEDYLRLADAALCLVQSFPEHEQRAEAMRRLPEALQAGGKYAEASEHFGAVPADSPYYQEARYRRALCMRLAVESERETLSSVDLRTRALAAAGELSGYSQNARKLADTDPERTDVRTWSAAALVSAAELYQSDGVGEYERALELLVDFERTYADQTEMGRVLAVRINACRALGRYDDAGKTVAQFLQSASEAQAGGTLASIARGMRDEVLRLEQNGNGAEARRVAEQSIPIFEQLETWALAAEGRKKYLSAVRFGLANMRYVAGQYEAAAATTALLLKNEPDNGSYRRLEALIYTRRAEAELTPAALEAAQKAWGRFLNDPVLREKTPERYQEARYYYLELLLLEGRAAEVENAIRQDRVWHADREASEWDGKFDELYERASGELD